MYYQSKFERFLYGFKNLILHFQGQNYYYLLATCLMLCGLSVFLNDGLPLQFKDLDLAIHYKNNPENFIIDTLAGLTSFFITLPTSYLWWKYKDEVYFYVHILAIIAIIIFTSLGLILSAAFVTVLGIAALIIGLIWVWIRIK